MIQRLSALLCDATSLAENDLDMVICLEEEKVVGYGERPGDGEGEGGKWDTTNPWDHVHSLA